MRRAREYMEVGHNVFAQSHDDAIVQNESGIAEFANIFGLNTLSQISSGPDTDGDGLPDAIATTEVRKCDFDGDGIDDQFLARV